MPTLPINARSLLQAMSDFWTTFVRDQDLLTAYSEGVVLNVAQLYQTFLETVLGTQLRDVPLFQRTFYAPYILREDQLIFTEGPSTAEDRYGVLIDPQLRDCEYITNRVMLPTRFLTQGREFELTSGALLFAEHPFESAVLTGFPLRVATHTTPATWRSAFGVLSGDVKPGDIFELSASNSSARAILQGRTDELYHLAKAPTFFQQTFTRRTHTARILRIPYDAKQFGVLVATHPSYAARLTINADDGVVDSVSAKVDLRGNAAYQGTWAATTSYAQGDIVDYLGGLYSALQAHTSTFSFDASLWDNLQQGYVYVRHAADPRVDGLYGLTSSGAAGILRTSSPVVFSATSIGQAVLLYRVRYPEEDTGTYKTFNLAHQHVTGLQLVGRRLVDRVLVQSDGTEITYLANEALEEGVDYVYNSSSGQVTVLSVWDPAFPVRASYSWFLEQASQTFTWRGTYANSTAYERGDLVRYENSTYLVWSAHTSDGTVDALRYRLYAEPFTFDTQRPVREIVVWLTDALRDEETLYRNFGALLGAPRASSELYRAFLLAVSRLYWLGPTKQRLESALNAILELPLIRENDELLLEYLSGIDASDTDAKCFGAASGSDGVLDATASTFAATSASFLATDVGGILRTITATGTVRTFTIASRLSATEVTVTPLPPFDEAQLLWSYDHPVQQNRVEISGSTYVFSAEDVGGWLRLYSTTHEHNDQWFKILSLESAVAVTVEAPFGLKDEINLRWELSRTGEQRVRTSRDTYVFPLTTTLRSDVQDSSNYRRLSFKALEPLSAVFTVEDIQDNPSWWVHTQIPATIAGGTEARRSVTPGLYPHVVNPVDGALVGDPGLRVGCDDQAVVAPRRSFSATWYGGTTLVLASAVANDDSKQVLAIATGPLRGYYRIEAIGTDNHVVTLNGFPPSTTLTPPLSVDVTLPPKLLRRSVAFVLFNTTLKHQGIHVLFRPDNSLNGTFFLEAMNLLQGIRPGHAYLYLDTPTSQVDPFAVEDELSVVMS